MRLIDADKLNGDLMKKSDELMDIKEPCMSGTVAGVIGIVSQQPTIETSDIMNAIDFGAYQDVKQARQCMENWKYEAQCEHDFAVEFMQKVEYLKRAISKYCGDTTKKYIFEYVTQLENDTIMPTE
ncbi:hypothetical protein SDC9_46797 [bioreactor metagenome]|uniref:Uncharacterized protein n=1 Tax=bioreactor metagenome TaxID=1076179 RepID=A0A644W9V3_9ZZZZ